MKSNKEKQLEREEILALVRSQFTKHLESKGLRKTPERFAILELIHKNKGHFDVEALHELMQTKYRVSRATLYNTLELLLECNLVIKHQIGNEPAKFERTIDNNHHHLICAKCGSFKEFGDESIKKLIHNKSLRGFQVSHFSLYIYGICNKCLKEAENK